MNFENKPNNQERSYTVSLPIKLTDENSEYLMQKCMPMLSKFAPESATRSFFTEKTDNQFVVLLEEEDPVTKEKRILGVSGFKVNEPEIVFGTDKKPVKVIYRSFTFIEPEVRGGGYYSKIQEQVAKIAKKENAEYQVLRTQNGRVWETAQKSFNENSTYPNPKTETPEEVRQIAQFYNRNPDNTNKPMSGLFAYTPFYEQLNPVERSCKNPDNTQFLESEFKKAHAFFQDLGIVDKNKNFEGIESPHPYSVMVISKFDKNMSDT